MNSIFKRIFLFMVVNLLVVFTVTTILSVLGVPYYFSRGAAAYGASLNYSSLAIFCLVWGMVGSFISLALSRVMAKFMMGVEVIDPNASGAEGDLVRMVHNLARAARLPAMPQVGIYDSPEINAFATGPTKSRALVAVSSGLLQRMNREEMEAVLGHEITHIANGDMVTLALLQGVINAFVMFISRVIAFAISQALSSSRDNDHESRSSPMLTYVITMVLEIILGFVGMMIVAYFSRKREFRADAGGATLAGRQKMIQALQSLQRSTLLIDTDHSSLATFKISGKSSGFWALFATHPPLEDRIQRLQMGR